jgi:hypothetical protein
MIWFFKERDGLAEEAGLSPFFFAVICGSFDPVIQFAVKRSFRGAGHGQADDLRVCARFEASPGGMRMLYRHVDILNGNGFSAYIVHSSPNFELDRFEYSTPVLRGKIEMKPQDMGAGLFSRAALDS